MKKSQKLLLGALLCLSFQSYANETEETEAFNNDRTNDPAVLSTCNQAVTLDTIVDATKSKLASENMDELVDWARETIKEEFKKTGRAVSTQDISFERSPDPDFVIRSVKRGRNQTDGTLEFGSDKNLNMKYNQFDFGAFTFKVGSKDFSVRAVVKAGKLEGETAQEHEVQFDSLGLPKKDITRCFLTGEFNNGLLDLGSYLEVGLVLENSNKEIGSKEYGFKVKIKKKINNIEE